MNEFIIELKTENGAAVSFIANFSLPTNLGSTSVVKDMLTGWFKIGRDFEIF
jgi:hypothetical protein